MSVFSCPHLLDHTEVEDLRKGLLHFGPSVQRVSEYPQTRYIHVLNARDIPCVQDVVRKALHLTRKRTGEVDWCVASTPGAVTLVTAAAGSCHEHQSWHRDTPYKAYVVCVPLVNVDLDNGCTEILEGSTRTSPNKWRSRLRRKVCAQCRAGDAYVFDQRLLHRGRANRSNEPRPVLFIAVTKRERPFFLDMTNAEPPL